MQKFGKLLILCLLIAASVVTGAEARAAGGMGEAMDSDCSISACGGCIDNSCTCGFFYGCKITKGGDACACVLVIN